MESNFEWITANGDIGIRFFHSIDDGGYSNPPHWHNDLEIIYLLEGRLKVRFGDGGERQIGADELLVINSGTIHAVTAIRIRPSSCRFRTRCCCSTWSVTISFTLLWMKGRPVRRKNKNSQNSKQFSGRWTRCTVRRKKGIS